MNDKQKIVLSDIHIEENKKEIIVKRKIYIDCMCDDIEHVGRIVLRKDINKDDKTSMFFMWLETNAKPYIKRYHVYDTDGWHKLMLPLQFLKFKFSDFMRRIGIIFSFMFKDTVYIPLDWEIMDGTISELSDAIKKSYDEINQINKEPNNE